MVVTKQKIEKEERKIECKERIMRKKSKMREQFIKKREKLREIRIFVSIRLSKEKIFRFPGKNPAKFMHNLIVCV